LQVKSFKSVEAIDGYTSGGDQKSTGTDYRLNVAQDLAQEYQVTEKTIRNDGQFAEGLEALKTIREDLPRSVVAKRSQGKTKGKGRAKVTKARVITVGKLIHEQQVTPPPFMRRGEWEDFQILEALPLLAQIPLAEHEAITAMLSTPPLPPALSLQILKNLYQTIASLPEEESEAPLAWRIETLQGRHADATGRRPQAPEGADVLSQGPRRHVQAGLGISQPLQRSVEIRVQAGQVLAGLTIGRHRRG
jgi:hypothetical protein